GKEAPDSSGHKFGPESTQRKNMIKQVDRTVGYLRQRIRESGLEPKLNLIVTSDHGMETVLKTDEIHLRTVSNFSFKDLDFELLDYGPSGLLVPKEGKLEHVYSVLKNAHPKLHVHKKEEFPKRFHYANHSRITPLLLYSDPGYVQFNKGEHGFDNEAMNMKTIFRAVGPAFRTGLVVEPFESVNVYALLCELLGITPEPHDGSLEVTNFLTPHQVTAPKDPRQDPCPGKHVPRLGVVSPGFVCLWSPPQTAPAGRSRGFTPQAGLRFSCPGSALTPSRARAGLKERGGRPPGPCSCPCPVPPFWCAARAGPWHEQLRGVNAALLVALHVAVCGCTTTVCHLHSQCKCVQRTTRTSNS
uniref:Ectonucleotide pyrophosphatase/phosphodiesterase 7 n=1 Tax=Ficedula albicollis TaxID=59894 RepID=A0A803VKG3_FICAL